MGVFLCLKIAFTTIATTYLTLIISSLLFKDNLKVVFLKNKVN